MKVLIVEDNAEKCRHLVDYLRDELKISDVSIRQSYRNGLAEIKESKPEVVLLDMSMPTYDRTGSERGGRMRVYAGRDILREIRRLGLPSRAVIVTMFESFKEEGQERTLKQLQKELEADFPDTYLGIVYYHASRSDWRQGLKQLLRPIIRSTSSSN